MLGFGFVMALMRIASDEERAARHIERSMDPFSDVPVMQLGSS
jgi:hypothetical protein